MLRIVRKSREQLIIDGYEAQLAERERVVQLLVEQVEYLRAQIGLPTATVSQALAPKSVFEPGVEIAATNALTDQEEELLALRQAEIITQPEYEEALERLARTGPSDIIE